MDVISYQVIKTEPFTIRETAQGDGKISHPLFRPDCRIVDAFSKPQLGKLCGSFLIDDAFEHYMREQSGLKFSRCQSPTSDFRNFVNEEWEYSMKRAFAGDEAQQEYYLRPPAKAFSRISRLKGSADRYALSK